MADRRRRFLWCLLALACAGGSGDADTVRAGALTISGIVAPAPIITGPLDSATFALYVTIQNTGDVADTLMRIESPLARTAMMHTTRTDGGMSTMAMLPSLPVPAHSTVSLAPGGTHAMLEGLQRAPVPGDTVPATLIFRTAGRVAVDARVVSYAELDSALRASRK